MAYSIIGIAKHQTMAKIAVVGQHNERTRETRNADRARRQDNERLRGSGDLCTDVQARLDAAGITNIRSNGVRAVEHMLTASPEWFREAGPENVREWVNRSMTFLTDRYGDNLVAANLHMDETSPQIHAVMVPITADGRLSARDYFGGWTGPAKLVAMHTSYNKAVADLGLERPTERSKAEHKDIQKFYHEMGQPTRDAWEAARQITIAPPTPGVSMEEHLAATVAPVLAAEKTRAQYWKHQAEQTVKQLQGAREQNRAYRMSYEEFGEAMNRVRETDLREVIQGLGATPDRYDHDVWHIDGKKINIQGTQYYDFHAPNDPMAHRGGAIDLVQYATRRTFTEAVTYLNERHYGGRAGDAHTREPSAYVQQVQHTEPRSFQLPPNAPDRWPEVHRYLVIGRGIPADLVDEAHGRGDLYATVNRGYPNAVFVRHGEDGQAVGASMRGARGTFYGMVKDSDKRAGFFGVSYGTPTPGHPPTLAVVESPIDALSYAALHRNGPAYGQVLSTDGIGPLPTRQIDETLAQGGTVCAGFDNDGPGGAGDHLWQQMKDAYPTETSGDYTPIMRQTPKGKDWNDDLEEHLPSAERSKDTPGLDMGSGPSMGR